MHNNHLVTAKGAFTAYAFACGYVEVSDPASACHTRIYQRHGVYFITVTKQGMEPVAASARTLTIARKLLATLKVQS